MLNLKYHIVSLVAVFSALGLGIFIGSNLVGDDVLAEQQQQLVTRLEEEFNLLREQNKDTQNELVVFQDANNNYRLFCEQVSPLIIENKLAGESVAVIQMNSSVATDQVVKTLQDAGAKVPYTASFDWETQPDWNLLKLPTDEEEPSKKENYKRLSKQVSDLLLYGTETEAIKVLRASGFLAIEGVPGKAVSGVVILEGGDEDRQEILNNFNTAVVEGYIQSGQDIVVGEGQGVLYPTMDVYKLKPVTTVDNLDNCMGQVSMVYALDGKPGHYGTGETADQLIPEMETE